MIGRKEKRLRVAISLVILSIITLSIIAYFYTRKVKATSQQINHTKNVLLGLNDLYKTVISHAGSARNFALEGNQDEVHNMRATASQLNAKLVKLKDQLSIAPIRKQLADSLGLYIQKRIEHSEGIIAESRSKGQLAAMAYYETGLGREYNNLAFAFINLIQATELDQLQLTEMRNAKTGRRLSMYILGLLGFIIALVIFIIQKIKFDRSEQRKTERQLKEFNETLEKQVKLKTKEKEHVNYLLNERIKELTTLHRASQLLQAENKPIEVMLQEIVNLLPGGWQYADITEARIFWDGKEFTSPNFKQSSFRQMATFESFGGRTGTIEVVYLEPRSDEVEGPFLAEERSMLNTLAEMLDAFFDRKHAEERLNQSYQEIRQLASYIEKAREDEKIRIAREIHDDLGQQLTGLKMDVSWLGDKLNLADKDSLHRKIEEMKLLLDEIVRSVRRISSELRPGILDDLGLVAAIKWQSNEFQKRSGINTRFNASSNDIDLPSSLSTGLFRIFQESLTNVARHSSAHHVTASLDVVGDELVLKISDDGVGFNVSSIGKKRTLGLLGMKERTALMGGTYEIVSNEGGGTSVKVSVPLKQNGLHLN